MVTIAEVVYGNVGWIQDGHQTNTRHLAVTGAPETLCDRTIGERRVDNPDNLPLCQGCRNAFKAEVAWSKK